MAFRRFPRALAQVRSSTLALTAAGVLLTSCNWNGDDGPAASATPSSTDARPTSPTPASVEQASYLFALRDVGDAAAEIDVVDPITGKAQAADTVAAGTVTKVARTFSLSSDGQVQAVGGQTAVYYVKGGKLYELSLLHPVASTPVPAPRRISAEAMVCEVLDAWPTDASATASLLRFSVAKDPGGDCTGDKVIKLIASNAGSTTAAVTSPFNAATHPYQSRLIDLHRDTSGKLTAALAFDADNHRLLMVPASTLAASAVPNTTIADQDGAVTGDDGKAAPGPVSVSLFSSVPGSSDQLYLLVGKEVRVWDWRDSTLSAAAVAQVGQVSAPVVTRDGGTIYYIDVVQDPTITTDRKFNVGLWSWAAHQASPVSVVANLTGAPVSGDAIPAVSDLVIGQGHVAAIGRQSGSAVLYNADVANKTATTVAFSSANVHVEGHAGNVLMVTENVLLAGGTTGSDTFATKLSRVDLSSSNDPSTMVEASVNLAGALPDARSAATTSYIVYGANNQMWSYNLATGNKVLLANNAEDGRMAGWNGKAASTDIGDGAVNLLIAPVGADTDDQEQLWLFNAALAGSAQATK